MTKYQSKFYANYLSLQQPNHGVQKLGTSLLNATIDLNPHQIDAALFFFNNPLNKGIMLADEVGLGKTIEAGLILCQLRSERKRKILLVVPASLRKQWVSELQEKFHLPAIIIDGPIYRKMMQENEDKNPFNQNSIIVTSYAFAASENSDKYNIRDQIESIEWDLVVFDEAHKLRNVYKSLESDLDEFTKNDIEKDEDENSKKRQTTAKRLFDRFENSKKLLLTATPLQNSLLELFGLLNFLDPRSFADLNSFKEQFNPKTMGQADFKFLRNRIQPYCQRTLRKQIAGDIKYTERKSLTQEYERSSEEEDFYNDVSDFLRTSTLFLNKAGHPNYLIVLIYWKLLASSVPAVLGTLRGLSVRIQSEINEIKSKNRREYKGEILDDEDMISIYQEDAEDNFSDLEDSVNKNIDESELKRLEGELFQLKLIIEKGEKLDHDNKAQALLQAIKTAYKQLEELGARKKVLIFTESRRTQDYLFKFLEENGYAGKIVAFNGDNNSPMVRNIYNEWKREYEHTSYFTGSLSSDTRAAIVDYFKNTAEIMIATESASEGVNLQFCSLVINYDLPWNPQRVEQRIGRCHRYGQEFDVIVMNIINTRNRADERVFDLLTQKFSLFQGVFGASDTILGSLESGIDIEKSILEIYQTCRTKEEIDQAFDKLQQDMADSVNERMEEAKTKVIDSFDEDVARRLKDKKENAELILGIMKERLLNLVKIECGNDAEEISNTKINLINSPSSDIPKGIYTIDSKDTTSYSLGTTDGLGKYCIDKAINQELSEGGITFDLTNHQRRISILEKLKGKSGYLRISKLTIDAYTTEDYLIYSGITDSGQELDEETIDKMLNLHGEEFDYQIPENIKTQLKSIEDKLVLSTRNESRDANQEYFEIEMDKIDNRSEDLKVSLEKKRKSIKMEIGELKKMYRMAQQLEEKISIQKKIKDLEKEDAKLRREQNDLEDQIDARKEVLIDEIEKRLEAESHIETLFTVRWEII